VFYERDEMQDLFQVTKTKLDYSHFLITSKFDNYKHLTENEFIMLSIRWKKTIKESIHIEDIGCVLNKGNIIVGIREDRKIEFLNSVLNTRITKEGKGSLFTEILELTKEETTSIIG
jgi:hypothetical protein